MKKEDKDYINYRIERSSELYDDALLLCENKRWKSCVNRLYYSSFQVVTALLYMKAITTKTHEGLKTKFFQEFIKTGIVPEEFGKLYSRLADWRQESDYSAYISFEEEDVKPLIEKVREFNDIILQLIEKYENNDINKSN